jgi:hypothetical protein
VRERLWTKSTSRGPQAPSVHHGPAPWPTSGADWSSASSHSGAQGRRGRGGEVEEAAVVTPTFYKNKIFVHIGVQIKMHIKL